MFPCQHPQEGEGRCCRNSNHPDMLPPLVPKWEAQTLLAYHTLFTRSHQPLDELDALPLSSHKRVAPACCRSS
jgi:hypothetical protein